MARMLIMGYGSLGRKLTPILAAGKHEIWGLNRRGETLSPAQAIKADLLQPETLINLPEVDYLIYTTTPSERSEAGYRNAYLIGLQNILTAYAKKNIRHIFFVSSTSVYGQSNGEWVDENSATEPKQFSGKAVLAAEHYLQQFTEAATCVRFGGIYGPQRTHLIRTVQAGQPVVKNPPIYTNRIHEDDCAGVLAFLMDQDILGKKLNTIYLAVDDTPVTEWEIKQWLAAKMGLPALAEKNAEAVVDQNKRCINRQLKALGYSFNYATYQQGYGAILEQK